MYNIRCIYQFVFTPYESPLRDISARRFFILLRFRGRVCPNLFQFPIILNIFRFIINHVDHQRATIEIIHKSVFHADFVGLFSGVLGRRYLEINQFFGLLHVLKGVYDFLSFDRGFYVKRISYIFFWLS